MASPFPRRAFKLVKLAVGETSQGPHSMQYRHDLEDNRVGYTKKWWDTEYISNVRGTSISP